MINQAIEKMRRSAEATDSPMAKMLSQQIIDNITTDAIAEKILAEDKTLEGCKKAFDDYASKNKKGKESVIDPMKAEELIYQYFGIEKGNPSTQQISNVINILDFV